VVNGISHPTLKILQKITTNMIAGFAINRYLLWYFGVEVEQ